MKQEEYDLLKAAVRSGAKQELELEKVQYMLSGAQHMLKRAEEENPELYVLLDLFRIWTEIRDARKQLEDAQMLSERVLGYLRYREDHAGSGEEEPAEYPAYPESFRSVAEPFRRKTGFREIKTQNIT